jgi:hypothetical protein
VLTAALAVQLFLVLGFFCVGIVAVWTRAARGADVAPSPTPPGAVLAPDSPPPSSGAWTAVVRVGNAEYQSGTLRDQPSFAANKIGYVPVGAQVDVLQPYSAQRIWYRVRTRETLPRYGWMHRDLLRSL